MNKQKLLAALKAIQNLEESCPLLSDASINQLDDTVMWLYRLIALCK